MPDDVFERFAGDYDRWFDEHHAEYQAELERIRALLPPPGPLALEVGAGSGRFAAPLGIRLGIEPSRPLCRMARTRGIEVVRAIGEAIPFRDASISSVLLVTVICFLKEPSPVLAELWRIVAPGGTAVIAFIERGGPIHQKYLHKGGKGRFLSCARFYTQEEVLAFLEIAGFWITAVDPRAGFCVIAAKKG
jgi:SAM-dependent methyltransferase